MTDEQQVLAGVGARLRQLRNRRELSLSEVSETTGISTSTLSRLESGQRKPTLQLLLPLARAYQVRIDDLVGAPDTGDPRIHPKPISRHGMTILPLTRQPGSLQAYKLIIDAGPVGVGDQQTHEGYEWLYVLSGRLRLSLGEHDLVLRAGEAAEFDTRTPHWFGSSDGKQVEFLSLFGRQGERMHVRARPRQQDRTG